MGFVTIKDHHLGPTIFGSLFSIPIQQSQIYVYGSQSREVVFTFPGFWVGNTSESEDLEGVFFWDGVLFLLVFRECSSAKTCMVLPISGKNIKKSAWNPLKLIIFAPKRTNSYTNSPLFASDWDGYHGGVSIFQDTKTVRRCTWIWAYGPIAFMLCEPGKPGKFWGGKTGEPWQKGAGGC